MFALWRLDVLFIFGVLVRSQELLVMKMSSSDEFPVGELANVPMTFVRLLCIFLCTLECNCKVSIRVGCSGAGNKRTVKRAASFFSASAFVESHEGRSGVR
jgi:hypothetical protein